MRILWISDSPVLATGYARVTREVLRRLASCGFEVGCLAWYDDLPGVVPLGADYPLFPGGWDYGDAGFCRALLEFRPDVVVGLGDVWMLAPTCETASAVEVPYVGYFPIDGVPGSRAWMPALRSMRRVVTCSAFASAVVERLAPGTPVQTIPHGCDPSLFRPLPERERRACLERLLSGLNTRPESPPGTAEADLASPHSRSFAFISGSSDPFVVGCVARNQRRKQLPVLMEAFACFAETRANAVLLLHTDVPDDGWDVPALARRWGIERKVLLPPGGGAGQSLGDDALCDLYNCMDLFVLPTMGEGFGLPILEAMACGVPVVATDCSAVTELTAGRGALIRPRASVVLPPYNVEQLLPDVQHLAQLLEELAADPEQRAFLSRTGREYAETMTWDRCAASWAALLDELAPHLAPAHRWARGWGLHVPAPPITTTQGIHTLRSGARDPASPDLAPPASKRPGTQPLALRLAVLSTFDYACGVGIYAEDLAYEWRRVGHEVWCLGEDVPSEFLRGEFAAEKVVRCWRRGGSFAAAADTVRRIQPDLLVIQHELAFCRDPDEWDSFLAACACLCPVVVTYHTWPVEPDEVTRNPRPAAVVLASPRAYRAAKAERGLSGRVWPIPHAATHPALPPSAALPHRVITWGFPGQRKGWLNALDALMLLRAEFPDATLTVHWTLQPPSSGQQMSALRDRVLPAAWVRGLGGALRVSLGWLPQRELQELIASHSLSWLLYPETETGWCSSGCLPMAWSASRPAITSRSEYFDVTEDLEPLICRADTPEEAAAATAALWRSEELYGDLCNRIHAYARGRGPAHLANDYCRVFGEVLGRDVASPTLVAESTP